MTSIRIVPKYEDNLWYPILVKLSANGVRIVELQGKEVNEHNRKVYENTKTPESRCLSFDET